MTWYLLNWGQAEKHHGQSATSFLGHSKQVKVHIDKRRSFGPIWMAKEVGVTHVAWFNLVLSAKKSSLYQPCTWGKSAPSRNSLYNNGNRKPMYKSNKQGTEVRKACKSRTQLAWKRVPNVLIHMRAMVAGILQPLAAETPVCFCLTASSNGHPSTSYC